jgi:hypothetical protein
MTVVGTLILTLGLVIWLEMIVLRRLNSLQLQRAVRSGGLDRFDQQVAIAGFVWTIDRGELCRTSL